MSTQPTSTDPQDAQQQITKVPITDQLTLQLAEIEIPQDHTTLPEAVVSNVVPLASYTWVGQDENTPRMLVPSCPSVYSAPALPFHSQSDVVVQSVRGFVPGNQDIFRSPESPLIPLVESVRFLNPSFDFSTIDLVTNRQNFRKLIESITRPKDPFRIDVEHVGNRTVLFSRWNDGTLEEMDVGYGFAFKKNMTDAAGRRPASHHARIIAYDFAGLRILLRSKIDAYSKENKDDGSLESLIESLSLKPTHSSTATPGNSVKSSNGVEMIPSSTLVSQSSLIEFAARASTARGSFKWANKFPQLYLAAIPNFMIGYHTEGTFNRVERFDVTDSGIDNGPDIVQRARERALPLLRKLGAVLNLIRDKVLELTSDEDTGSRRGRLFSVVYQDGQLGLYERAGGPELPDNLAELF
ncbi:hypothetical protein DL93DRAFT_2228614 [Clavulina sp. PMI_390]|nr:hypothetical protein DL93DRAFT_2228614 [Clavulina sp. PMI_390]